MRIYIDVSEGFNGEGAPYNTMDGDGASWQLSGDSEVNGRTGFGGGYATASSGFGAELARPLATALAQLHGD